jgi:hypothetical protein
VGSGLKASTFPTTWGSTDEDGRSSALTGQLFKSPQPKLTASSRKEAEFTRAFAWPTDLPVLGSPLEINALSREHADLGRRTAWRGKPPILPPAARTLWHGMISGTRFLAMA